MSTRHQSSRKSEEARTPPAGFELRELAAEDAADGLRLSRQAGWNQTQADWEMILRLGYCTGIFRGADLVGTTASLYWGPFAWIAMVLVDEACRRRGLGAFLLQLHINEAGKKGKAAALDASEQGLPLYKKNGFGEVCRMTRYIKEGSSPAQPALEDEFPAAEIAAIDSRHTLLGDRRSLFRDFSRRRLAIFKCGNGDGFACLRPGDLATQVGPVIAPDAAAATGLVAQAVQASAGASLLLDVPDFQKEFRREVEAAGFSPRRTLVRMLRARDPRAIHPSDNVFAVAGPELG